MKAVRRTFHLCFPPNTILIFDVWMDVVLRDFHESRLFQSSWSLPPTSPVCRYTKLLAAI
jgi:hypothetical protein